LQPSPIELVHYFLASVHFEVNTNFNPEDDLNLLFESIKTELTAHHHEENNRQWNLELRVHQTPEEGENFPYIFDFHVLGMVEVAPGVKEESVADLAKINGASLLFGFVREQMRSLSSSSPFGAILLPSVSFLDLKDTSNNAHT